MKSKICLFLLYFIYHNLMAIEGEQVFFTANHLLYNSKKHLITATDNVELIYKNNLVNADQIIYDNKSDEVTAKGNIRFLEKDNNYIFADNAYFRNSMNIGRLSNFKARFNDNSLLASNEANLTGDIYNLDKAVYSPCSLCENKKPLWQIKAKKVKLDKAQKNISYEKARLEVYGVPVLYMPYFSHPTSDAEAKNGLLAPSIGRVSSVGRTIELPIYFRVKSNIETIISPVFISDGSILWKAKYNHLTKNGFNNFKFSYIDPKKKSPDYPKHRWHIQAEGRYNINPNWHSFYDIKTVSDQTYLKNYKFGNEDHLVSQISLNYNKKHNYSTIKSLYLESLVDDNLYRTKNSLLLPYSISHFETDRINNSNFYFDNNLTILARRHGHNFNRLSNNLGFKKLFINNNGHVFEIDNSVRFDMYYVDKKNKHNSFMRATPSLQIDWNYPLIKNINDNVILLKPMANFIITRKGFNDMRERENIDNEDSLNLEISDDNLFKADKFSGLDLIEEGSRINYGVNSSLDNRLGKFDLLVGQNYRLKKSDLFSDKINKYNRIFSESGMIDQLSDYVGKVSYNYRNMKIFYRYRIDKDNFDFNKNEIGVIAHYSRVSFLIDYLKLDNVYKSRNRESDRQQIFAQASFKIDDEWNISGYIRKNLSKSNKKIISSGGNLNYVGDCVDARFTLDKDFTHYKNQKKNSLSYFFTLSLKNITK